MRASLRLTTRHSLRCSLGAEAMPTRTEIASGLRGALRLFLFDAQGLGQFDVSINGFWNSFFVAVLVAPLYFGAVAINHNLEQALLPLIQMMMPAGQTLTLPSFSTRLTLEAIAYPLDWIAFPLAMIPLARLLKRTATYVPYIIAYNWSQTVTALLQLTPLALYAAGLLGPQSANVGLIPAFFASMVYRWYITRVALGVTASIALALVFIDALISLLLARIMDLFIS